MTRLRLVFTLGILVLVATSARPTAQARRIASPAGRSATEVGGHHDVREGYVGGQWIEVRYGRPIKRGRDLFGPDDHREFLNDGAPVWRAPDKDVVRLPMLVETLPRSFDQLSWQFLDMTDTGGTLALLWDTTLASVPFTVVP